MNAYGTCADGKRDTFFAPAPRAAWDELQQEIGLASQSPVIDALLRTNRSMLILLNEYRQILAVNDAFLRALGLSDSNKLLGLRPGEALGCIHAGELAGGCGTSTFCSTCGAAVAIVSALHEQGAERDCALRIGMDGASQDLFFHVSSFPLTIQNRLMIGLLLIDATQEQRRAALERVFFHDIRNTIFSLQGAIQLMDPSDAVRQARTMEVIRRVTSRLFQEVTVQQLLSQSDLDALFVTRAPVLIGELIADLKAQFESNPLALSKTLDVVPVPAGWSLNTDRSLLFRILANMLTNALEASEDGDPVKLWVEQTGEGFTFCVWNRRTMPFDVARRVFQRNFSTKEGRGRGLGTYCIKMLAEHYLGGKAGFITSDTTGTTFRVTIPEL